MPLLALRDLARADEETHRSDVSGCAGGRRGPGCCRTLIRAPPHAGDQTLDLNLSALGFTFPT